MLYNLVTKSFIGQNAFAQSQSATTSPAAAPTTSAETAVAPTTGAPKQASPLEMFLPFIFIFAIFYFLILRPQAKRQKEQQTIISGLKKGDSVITSSGILGVIDGLTDTVAILEVAEGVKIRVLRTQIAGLQNLNK